jgi:WD40-like Beta Propeller Repeat
MRSGSNPHFVTGELWQVELDSGRRERLLPDFVMSHYAVSADGNRALFSVPSASGKFAIWIASLDRRFAPRQLVVADSERAFLTPQGEVFFVAEESQGRYIYRIKEDGTGRQQLAADSVATLVSVSPNGEWVVAWVPSRGEASHDAVMEATSNAVVAYPTAGGSPLFVCDNCAHAGGPSRGLTPPLVSWSPDGRYIYFSLYDEPIAVPLPPGQDFPVLPRTGLSAQKDLTSLPGALVMARKEAFPGPSPSLYAFCRTQAQRNLYQIPLP